jgi:hypothetical protein
VYPLDEKIPYKGWVRPPYTGATYPPAEAGPNGHFDHLSPNSRQFISAHAFACVRRVLDVCESYVGREIPWFFEPLFDRLEIIPHLSWNNAQSGFGFLEIGEDDSRERPFPFALNFDVMAHETGHLVLLGALGLPSREPTPDFLTFHEAVADFISLLGLLHFDTALDHMLRRTRGNLFISNELDRLAELADEKQIRTLSHSLTMDRVGSEIHDRSRPFSGALFDSLIQIFHIQLFRRGVTLLDAQNITELRLEMTQGDVEMQLKVVAENYEVHHFTFKSALIEARDVMGETLARSWSLLDPTSLSLPAAAEAFLAAAEAGRSRPYVGQIRDNFLWRGL